MYLFPPWLDKVRSASEWTFAVENVQLRNTKNDGEKPSHGQHVGLLDAASMS